MFDAYVRLRQIEDQNTDGGTFTAGAPRTRIFNSEYDPQNICTVTSSKQFSLPAGVYYAKWRAPAHDIATTGITFSYLWDEDSSTIKIHGTVSRTGTVALQGHSYGEGWFSVGGTSIPYEIRHYATVTRAGDGFGVKSEIAGSNSIYTVADLYRVVTTG